MAPEETLLDRQRSAEAMAAKPAAPGEKAVKKGVLYVGMDLGCWKTSIASSNGMREQVFSVVGWPKDPISRKLLGKDIIFGNEAYQHRLALNMVRPFEKGALKYADSKTSGLSPEQIAKHKEAARELVRHAVAMARPEKGLLIHGVLGAPARAAIHAKQALLEACKGTFDSVMVVSEPFAVAYGMNMLEDAIVIDIGAGTTDLCRMHGAIPEEADQITLPIAGDSVDEQFYNLLRKKYPEAQFSINMVREIKEKFSFVHDVNEKAVVTLPVDGKPQKFDVTEPLKEACKSIVPPIVKGLRELVGTFDPEFQRRMLNNTILAGGGSQIKGLDRLIEQAMEEYGGCRITKVNEPVFAGANGALKLAADMPEEYWQELS
ncbi:MAG: rod shape-determining protein [Planctomycetes bacterium]|nr:rod shape-determining protein [Planctomycetota bacterium]